MTHTLTPKKPTLLYGMDFTSHPTHKKPLCVAHGYLPQPNHLVINDLTYLDSWEAFELFLNQPGPWVCGFDFPLSQPKSWITNLGWSTNWLDYTQKLTSQSKQAYELLIKNYISTRPQGQKLHYRPTDRITRSSSPMLLNHVPVGKMYYQGSKRLLKAAVSILPVHPQPNYQNVALETYPSLIARQALGKLKYKSDEKSKQLSEHHHNRLKLFQFFQQPVFQDRYQLFVTYQHNNPDVLWTSDPKADTLDALCCLIQTAWGYEQRQLGYGIPNHSGAQEGWIVDPTVFKSLTALEPV